MFKYPDQFITPTSAYKNLNVKTFAIRRQDIYQGLANATQTNQFGFSIQQGQGNQRGLKAEFPGQSTIAGIFLQNPQLATPTGTGVAATIRLGKVLPVLGISAPNASTTATVYCAYAHGLTSSDTVLISDSVAVVQGTGAAYATPTAFNNCTPITVNGITTNTVGGPNQGTKTSYTVTPSATDPTVFTITLSATTTAAIQAGAINGSFGIPVSGNNTAYGPSLGTLGLVVADSYFGTANVFTGGISLGYQIFPGLKNVGVFQSVNTTSGSVAGYWQVQPANVVGYNSTPGTPQIWCVSNALNAQLGDDGNYNYFVEPTSDLQMTGYYQETVTSGTVTSSTIGGPWVVFVFYFQ